MDPLAELIGESPGIVALRHKVRRILERQSDLRRLPPILILGETGTGKGLLARAIHRAGSRRDGPFVDVNCAAIPENLLEAEMFGFERGAFTDARQAKPGLFQAAHGGTIFLDEVGLLPEALQGKLLKVIEEQAVRRLGSTRSEPVDVWVLSATSVDLATATRERRFREDLYHRLAVLTASLPPLRERGQDILLLAEDFLARECAKYGLAPKELAPDARAALLTHHWSGNVRELANVTERVTLLSQAPVVTADMLELPVSEAKGPAPERKPAPLEDVVASAEREHLLAVLHKTHWNITRAAEALGISRDTLRYRITKYDLRPADAAAPRGSTADPHGATRAAPPGVQRKLTAILSADVQAYSRLMAEDEVATVRTLTAYREVMATRIRRHRGRVVDAPGDNLLAEFASVVDAVECAVEIQRELKARNRELPEHRRMEFRIGINLGDVVVEGERIYGDGVNIAARVETLAEPGSISISGTVYEHVRKKLALRYEFLGERIVKNITEPVQVYRVREGLGLAASRAGRAKRALRTHWQSVVLAVLAVLVMGAGAVAIWNVYLRPVPPPARMALPLPDKPSVAVLPFVNLSGDPAQDYFSDGMTVDIITTLSKIAKLFVIDRHTMSTYKGRRVTVQQVSEELGVRYVLEGSVQKSGDRVRVSAQLVDANTGAHLWADRYDHDLKDVFAVQDEITQEILTALEVKLTEGEQAQLRRGTASNLEAYEYLLRGAEHFRRFTKDGNVRARHMWERAIDLDPEFALPYVGVAWTLWMDARYRWGEFAAESLERARELATKALALEESHPDTHSLLGSIHLLRGEHEQAIAEGEEAVRLNPNGADAAALLALTLNYSGRPEEGLVMIKRAMRLSPFYSAWYLAQLGLAYRLTGRHEEAIEAYERYRDRNPDSWFSYVALAGIYSELGREEEAGAEAAELQRVHPEFSVERYGKALPFREQALRERFLAALRKAGLE